MAPRLSAARRRTPTTPAPAAKGSVPGDNVMAGEEAERVQLISIVSQLSAAEDAIELAKAPLKAAQKKRSQIIGLGKAAGFTAKELGARLDEMRMGTREMAEREHREHKQRRWLGIIDADQSQLILGDQAPQEVKDEAHWKGEGYKAGLRQLLPKPPPECPERFVQPWLSEHARGHLEVTTANAPRPLVADQAAKDFADDNPEVDVDAAARKLRNDPAFMDRGAPEADEPDEAAGADPVEAGPSDLNVDDDDCAFCGAAPQTSHAPGCRVLDAAGPTTAEEPFEATEEELAAQRPRAAVQGARDPDADEEVV